MLLMIVSWRQSDGWTPIRSTACGDHRRAAAATNDDASRMRVRLAQVMAEPRRKCRPGHDRRIPPMVRHDEHRDPLADGGMEHLAKAIDLAFEAGRDVVDRGEQQSGHSRTLCAPASGLPH